jgi:thiol:disulfide interchange protein DsbD
MNFMQQKLSIITPLMAAIWLALTGVSAQAQSAHLSNEKLVQASLIVDVDMIKKDAPFWVGVKLDIAPGWHVYWQNPGDSGIETAIDWNLPAGLIASPIHWPSPEAQPYSGLMNYGYSNQVILPVSITPQQAFDTVLLQAKISWLACKDICIPESATLRLDVPISDVAAKMAIGAALDNVPALYKKPAAYIAHNDLVSITLPADALPENAKPLRFFPIDDGVIQNAAKQVFIRQENGDIALQVGAGTGAKPADAIRGVLRYDVAGKQQSIQFSQAHEVKSGAAANIAALPAKQPAVNGNGALIENMAQNTATISIAAALLLAFIGGLLLNLMPCVLPIVALKALSIVAKTDAPRRETALQGIAYTAGVLATMLLLGGVLLTLKAAGESVGWGFQLQSPAMVVSLSLLMLLVGMFLLNWFNLPTLFTGIDQKLGTKKGALGSFFTGILSVAVATPCTAPFMAPALGAAATMPPVQALSVLVSLGLGLSFPYLLISIWPAARVILPKPGAWMESFKQALAFPMFATSAWLLWVLVQLNGAMGLGYALIGIVLLGFAIWLYRHSTRRFWRMLALLIGAFALWQAVDKQPPVTASATVPVAQMKNGIAQMVYSEQNLADLRKSNVPVLVDATAAWCITCKLNEQVALRNSAVEQHFRDAGITLMIADWTMRDEAISAYLAKFGRNGVPLYVWYAPSKPGVVLPQILTPSIVLDALAL